MFFFYSVLYCGGTIKEHDGRIYPPNPVAGEPDYDFVSCEWMIDIHPGHTLQFQLIFLRIQETEYCRYYFLQVRPEIHRVSQ